MAVQTVTFEAGTNGNAISGSSVPTGASQVDITGSPTSQYSNAQTAAGSLAWYANVASAQIARLRVTLSASGDRLRCRFYMRLVANPSASGCSMCEVRDTSSAIPFQLALNSSSVLQVIPKSGGTVSLGTLSLNTWYRVEFEIIRGTTSSNGSYNVRYYAGSGTTAVNSATSSTADVGTVNLNQVCFGKLASSPGMEAYFDEFAVEGGSTDPLGPVGTNSAPTVSAGTSQTVERETTVTLQGTATDADGTIASRAWSCTEYPPGSTLPTISDTTALQPTVPLNAAGRYVFSFTATDNAGATSTPATVTHYVYPHSGEAVGIYSVNLGTWTKVGSAGTTRAGLVDADDTTGIQSPSGSSGQECTIVLNPVGPAATIPISLRGKYVDAAVTRTVKLCKNDGTVIYTTTQTPAAALSALTFTPDAAAMAQIASVTDRTALQLKISATAA